MRAILLVTTILVSFATPLPALPASDAVRTANLEIDVQYAGPDPRKGIIAGSAARRAAGEEAGYRFLARFVAQCGVMSQAEDFELLRLLADDEEGLTVMHVRQPYQGIPVYGAESVIEVNDDGTIAYFTDGFVRNVEVSATPAVTPEEAVATAAESLGCAACTRRPIVDTLVRRIDGVDRLAYEVSMTTTSDASEFAQPITWVDAHSGAILEQYEGLQSHEPVHGANKSMGPALYEEGDVTLDTYWYHDKDDCDISLEDYRLIDSVHHVSTVTVAGTWHSPAIVPGAPVRSDSNSFADSIANAIHYNLGRTLEYYNSVHMRIGVDGNDGPSTFTNRFGYCNGEFEDVKTFPAIAHYKESNKSGELVDMNNAFWSPHGYMAFGDGTGGNFTPFVSLDVAAHEATHGVTNYTSRLVYRGESGALNESFSDCMAAAVESHYGVGQRFDIGERVCPGCPRRFLRSMQQPHASAVDCADNNPDHVSERCGNPGDPPSSANDNGFVHSNSSIPNHAFYLLSVGGLHHLTNIRVPTLGIERTARIWYVAFTTKVGPNTSFAGARAATLAVVRLSETETRAVELAWRAVGVGGPSLIAPRLKKNKKLSFAAAESGIQQGATVRIDGYETFTLTQSANGKQWLVAANARSAQSNKTIAELFADGDQHVVTIHDRDGAPSTSALMRKSP